MSLRPAWATQILSKQQQQKPDKQTKEMINVQGNRYI
jgi:hypothetical protein